jgi:phosphoribosylformimino-5-aminoimidazole carboxamide ribotide isomerase
MNTITIIPAIDLKNGRCVRLRQGKADQETVYSDNPVDIAKQWLKEGAQRLHIVDLDGAFKGSHVHIDVLKDIVCAVDIPIEFGGGLRTDEDIDNVLQAGAKYAIIGTRACESANVLIELVEKYGEHIIVGIDAHEGKVQTKGWTKTSQCSAIDLARIADKAGVSSIIYTDTSKDGMLQGISRESIMELCQAVSCEVIASGGISSVEDIKTLRDLHGSNLTGAIVGKALYEGTVSLRELLKASQEE